MNRFKNIKDFHVDNMNVCIFEDIDFVDEFVYDMSNEIALVRCKNIQNVKFVRRNTVLNIINCIASSIMPDVAKSIFVCLRYDKLDLLNEILKYLPSNLRSVTIDSTHIDSFYKFQNLEYTKTVNISCSCEVESYDGIDELNDIYVNVDSLNKRIDAKYLKNKYIYYGINVI